MVELVPYLSEKHLSWRNDKRVRLWTRQNGWLTQEDHERWWKGLQGDPSRKFFGILAHPDKESVLKVGGQLFNKKPVNVGTCGLTGINLEHGHAEFSLLIGPEYHRKGYGREALKELLKYGFKVLRLNHIRGETFEGNPAYNLFKELGFQDCGCFHGMYYKFGEWKDCLLLEMNHRVFKEQSWA